MPTPPKSSRAPNKAAAKKPTPPRAAIKKATARATAPKRSANGTTATPRDDALTPSWGQQGDALTTSLGVKVDDTDNSLRISSRGPTLLEDFHLREKIMHFDHERIPERVVHARGAGAHGQFELTTSLDDITCAEFLRDTASADAGVRALLDRRRLTRLGRHRSRRARLRDEVLHARRATSTSSATTSRCSSSRTASSSPTSSTRRSPSPIARSRRRRPRTTRSGTSCRCTPESTHMLMWAMSDRAIPRSFRTMEGFGVHTFRLVQRRRARPRW